MQAALRVWRSFYCDGMFTRCERYKLAEAGAPIPDRLLPNGRIQDDRGGSDPSASGSTRAA